MDIYTVIMWIHLVAATVWVGPQVFLFVAGVPAMRTIEQSAVRVRAMEVLTKRYSYLANGALAVLILTGLVNADHQFRIVSDPLALRYGWLLLAKVVLVLIVIALAVYHGYSLGPRMLELMRSAATGGPTIQSRLKALRRQSMIVSSTILLLSVLVLAVVVLLQSGFAYETV